MPNSNGPQSRKIAVVGAGIAGVSNALYLQRDGHNVTLLDPEPPGSMASFGNSGLIAAYSCMPTATPDMLARVPKLLMDPTGPLSIRWTYLPQLLPWLASLIRNSAPERILANATVKARLLDLSWEAYRTLIEDADAGDLVAQGGMLRVYRTEAAFAASKGRELKTMRATGRKLEILGADEIRQLEPGLEPIFTNAYFFPDTYGILNPGRLTEVFAAAGYCGRASPISFVTGPAAGALRRIRANMSSTSWSSRRVRGRGDWHGCSGSSCFSIASEAIMS